MARVALVVGLKVGLGIAERLAKGRVDFWRV